MPTLLHFAQRLAAYLPNTLVQEILERGLPQPGQPRSLQAATLFADISGFTAMSEELASDGPRGAEELNRVLLTTFTAMIGVIHEMGGAVAHFHGDAMSVYFPLRQPLDEPAEVAQRALVCAQLMQQLMRSSFNRAVTNRPPGKNPIFPLTIKIGAAYGACQEMVVGDPDDCLEFVLWGTAVDAAANAEKFAGAGQVAATAELLHTAGLDAPTAARHHLLTDRLPLPPRQPHLDWSAYSLDALQRLINAAHAFIPPSLTERLARGNAAEFAEHRPVTSLFVQFACAGNETAGSLHAYYQWAWRVVRRFGGHNARINRILTGDKGYQLHIIFGAPVAPDAPDQAIRCALALIAEQPDYVTDQRIGLAAGKVFSGPVGATARWEYTVVGDVVNQSARLAEASAPNQVLTNAATATRARDLFEFSQLPPLRLKGKQDEIVPHTPLGERPSRAQLQVYFGHWERPFIGRDTELDLLLGGMDAALRQVGGLAAIIGAVGVGKTRLLAEGVRHWLAAEGLVLAGVCQEHINDTPYGPWQSIWQDFFSLRPEMSQEQKAQAVLRHVRSLVPECGDDASLWGEVLGLPIPVTPELAKLPAEVRQTRFFALVNCCFRAAAAERPLLIILEDAHWADRSSLALLDSLAQNLENKGIFVAVTFRLVSELNLAALERPSCIPIILGDLSATMARRLLQVLVGVAELPPSVEQHLGLRDREGRDSPVSPLFLEESVNVMLRAGVLRVNGRLQVDEEKLAHLQIPDTIHGLLLARLDRLPTASRDLLQIASVIGRQFALEPLEKIASDMPRPIMSALLDELAREDLTQLITTDPELIYLFQHALTHEVAYESLSYARRQALHQAMGDWIIARFADNLRPYHTLLAYHYSRADVHEEGLRYALAAADDARNIFANEEAADLYRLAESHLLVLGKEERWETAVALYLSRAECLRFLGDFNAAMGDVAQAIALAEAHQDAARLAQAFNLMADLKYRHGSYDEMKHFASQVVTQLAEQIPADELAHAYRWLGVVATAQGNYEVALNHLQIAEKLNRKVQNQDRLARVLESIAFVCFLQKKLEMALVYMQQSVNLSRDFSIPANTASSLSNIALVQYQLGRPLDALETLEEALAIGRQVSLNFLAHSLINKAEILCYLGQFDEAQICFSEANALFDRMDDERGLLEMTLVKAYEYCIALKKWDQAMIHLRRAEEMVNSELKQNPETVVRILLGFGQVALAEPNLLEAQGYLAKAFEIVEAKEVAWWRPTACLLSGKMFLMLDEFAKAAEMLRYGIASVVSNDGCPDYLPLLYLTLAEIEPDKRVEHLQNCIATAKNRARYVDRVYCLEAAGAALAAMRT